jgi:SAM-dependent methyltransferase
VPSPPAAADRTAAACAWCGADLSAGGRRGGGRIACARCGAATTDPWPSQEVLASAYAGWYRPAEGRFAGAGDALLRRARGTLAGRLDRIAPPGRVLDVGAGDGALLDALRARGRDALGLELVSTRPDVLALDVADVEETDWAAVVFWHSLEHLPEPGRSLARAAALLRSGGVLVVAVPNSDSLQARVFGDRWFALDLPRHLVHLPAETLLRRLDELGLRRRRVSHLRGGQVVFGWLHGLVDRLPGRPNLYDAIRRPEARSAAVPVARRAYALGAAAVLLPVAALAAALEAALRRGGSVYVEAVRG